MTTTFKGWTRKAGTNDKWTYTEFNTKTTFDEAKQWCDDNGYELDCSDKSNESESFINLQ